MLEAIFPGVGEDGVQRFHAAVERKSRRCARRALGGKEDAGGESDQDKTKGEKVWYSQQTDS